MGQVSFTGKQSINELKSLVQKFSKTGNIFVVSGKQSFEKSGAKKILTTLLDGYGLNFFSDFEVNPKIEDAIRGVSKLRKSRSDLILAIGGGSVMDMAKCIALLPDNLPDAQQIIRNNATDYCKSLPIIAVPTTHGTGSEATSFAVVYINNTKFSLADSRLLPVATVLDANLCMSTSSYQDACSTIDALCQSIESIWSTNSTETSRKYAQKAISIILANAVSAISDRSVKAKDQLLLAANLAGKAINISKTTAAHAVSYPITSFFGIPHGHAVALTINDFVLFNSKVTEADCNDKRGLAHVKKIFIELTESFNCSSIGEIVEKTSNLCLQLQLELDFTKLGIDTGEKIQLIVEKGFNPQRIINNPRLVTREELEKLLMNKIS